MLFLVRLYHPVFIKKLAPSRLERTSFFDYDAIDLNHFKKFFIPLYHFADVSFC